MYLTWLFVFTVTLAAQVESAKILGIFWTFARSHHHTGSALLQALATKGHEVHLLSTFNDDVKIPNFKQELLEGIIAPDNPTIKAPFLKKMAKFIPILNKNVEKFWENEAVQKLIQTKPKYDVVIVQSFYNDFVLALPHYLEAPTIIYSTMTSSAMNNKYVANPNLPYGKNLATDAPLNTLFGRLGIVCRNMVVSIVEKYFLAPTQDKYNQIALPGVPSVQQLIRNVSLVLVNSHYAIEPARPYVPNMVQIGGFHVQNMKKLPENLQNYLDSAKDGAVLFSMGSVVKIAENFPKKHLDIIMRGLGKIAPIKVLFKSEVDISTAPKNVLVSSWLPQNDILAHPNIKLFISHGGIGGTTEAVFHGVPVLGIPFFADQKANVASLIKSGFAAMLEPNKITQESFDSTIGELLTNTKYVVNAKKRSSLLKKQPVKPLENAIWWIEHIIQHKGGEHLRNVGMDLEWYQLYMVDITLFFLVIISSILVISFLVTRWMLKKLIALFSGKQQKVKNS
ncbi:hypothetical protein HHI36_003575 [Cryptolaemus montrouzieri]|uniref:UDP-glucuronosyltransferase n=1 Tax=Cryptolaemus montrouzieri TaxID=559131 RepID=A0ABD2PDT4_9CUCU